MSDKDISFLSGTIVEETTELSLGELCRVCSVQMEFVMELVDEGAVEAARDETNEWRFAGASVRRVRTALRLQHDLGVNAAGAALIMDLLDEIERLRARFIEPG